MLMWRAEQEVATVQGLIRMRRAGYFEGVFVDQSRITLQMPSEYDVRRFVSWPEARRIVDEFERGRRKPASKASAVAIRKDERLHKNRLY